MRPQSAARLLLAFSCINASAASPAPIAARLPWLQLIASRSPNSALQVAAALRPCRPAVPHLENCVRSSGLTDAAFERLVAETGRGSVHPAVLLLQIERYMDGADHEEADESLGEFFDRKPRTFLMLARAARASTSDTVNMLTSDRFKDIDCTQAQEGTVKRRLASLRRLKSAQAAVTLAVSRLRKDLIELRQDDPDQETCPAPRSRQPI